MRRRAQAKARRDADLDGYREAELERQRACRRRRREAGPRAPEEREEVERSATVEELSRAEWAAQVHVITSVIVANVDRAAVLSRAEFGRQVSRIVREGVHNLGKVCA